MLSTRNLTISYIRPSHLVSFIFLIVIGFSAPVTAAEFKDGVRAYRLGDYATALTVLKPLADRGDPDSQNLLGWIYSSEGKGWTKDIQKASIWFRKSAEQGNAKAQFNLGKMFLTGKEIGRNFSKAAYWFSKASEQGSQGAQYYLARLYEVGAGVPKDEEKAARLWKNLAEHGWAIAQYETGKNYRKGRGVPKDLVSAHMWADLAARSGRNEPANDLLQLVTRHMSPEQIRDANHLAEKWSPKAIDLNSRDMEVQYQFTDPSGKAEPGVKINLPF
ncbi:MAG: sel1 repeat family protein [Rhodospirillales bacterium]|nr:sel1 repeat family protein [Rhodospirillales bacterium]